MAKKKIDKTEEEQQQLSGDLALTQRKAMKASCINCGSTRPIVTPDVRVGFGGIKCHSCNKYDRFYGEFKINNIIHSLITIPYFDKCDTKEERSIGHVSYVLCCGNAGNICGFFKENSYTLSEINNALYDLGICADNLKKYYSRMMNESDIEKQVVRENKLVKKLKKVIKE